MLRHNGKPKRWSNAAICVPFLVLDLCFDVIDSVGGFNFEGDGLPGEGLDEDLHAKREAIQWLKLWHVAQETYVDSRVDDGG